MFLSFANVFSLVINFPLNLDDLNMDEENEVESEVEREVDLTSCYDDVLFEF